MASAFSHLAVPLVLRVGGSRRKIPWKLLGLGLVLSMAPDLDAIAFRLGIPYESPWGHRGFTHSIVFAFSIAMICTIWARRLKTTRLSVFWFAFLSMVSHGLLDALTNGGLGVAFFWPATNARYFLPWKVIQVSPISIRSFFTSRGWEVMKSELLFIWLPCCILGILLRIGKKTFTRFGL